MLRWSLGYTMKDRKRNDDIRAMVGVRRMGEKIQGERLRWFGHVERRDEDHVVKRAHGIVAPGKRRKGAPLRRWMDCVKADMKELGIEKELAQDRSRWRRATHMADPKACILG